MTKTKKDFKYSLRQCRKNAEMHKANALAAALLADNAHVFFCLLGITSSKAALEQNSRA